MSSIFDVAGSTCEHGLVLILCDDCRPMPDQSVLVPQERPRRRLGDVGTHIGWIVVFLVIVWLAGSVALHIV